MGLLIWSATLALVLSSSHFYLPLSSESGAYYCYLELGSPEQTLSFLIDTGSSWLWAPSGDCGSCVCEDYFYKSQSTSYKSMKTWLFVQGQWGSCYGEVSLDVITVDEQKVESEFLLVAQEYNFGYLPSDGVLGLPIGAFANSTLVNSLVAKGAISRPSFELHLGLNGTDDSYLLLGGSALSSGRESHSINLRSGDAWGLPLTAVSIQSNLLALKNATAVIDSSTNSLQVPSNYYNQVIKAVMWNATECWDQWQCECNSTSEFPSITLTLGDYRFSIPPEDYITIDYSQWPHVCSFLISPANSNLGDVSVWTLGTAFLQSHDIFFDYAKYHLVIESDRGSSSSKHFPIWAIVVICVAGAAVLLVTGGVVLCCLRRKKSLGQSNSTVMAPLNAPAPYPLQSAPANYQQFQYPPPAYQAPSAPHEPSLYPHFED